MEKERVEGALNILKEIIDKKELTHADLAMLIDKIVVHEQKAKLSRKTASPPKWSITQPQVVASLEP